VDLAKGLVAAPAIGGVLFVPGLVVFAHLSQLEIIATSLVTIVLVALVGAARPREYGNIRLRDGLAIGLLALSGSSSGVVVANACAERALELGFAGVQLVFAGQLAGNAGLR
jgi:uncharacterized protein